VVSEYNINCGIGSSSMRAQGFFGSVSRVPTHPAAAINAATAKIFDITFFSFRAFQSSVYLIITNSPGLDMAKPFAVPLISHLPDQLSPTLQSVAICAIPERMAA
jgi:hypothetical protein